MHYAMAFASQQYDIELQRVVFSNLSQEAQQPSISQELNNNPEAPAQMTLPQAHCIVHSAFWKSKRAMLRYVFKGRVTSSIWSFAHARAESVELRELLSQ